MNRCSLGLRQELSGRHSESLILLQSHLQGSGGSSIFPPLIPHHVMSAFREINGAIAFWMICSVSIRFQKVLSGFWKEDLRWNQKSNMAIKTHSSFCLWKFWWQLQVNLGEAVKSRVSSFYSLRFCTCKFSVIWKLLFGVKSRPMVMWL